MIPVGSRLGCCGAGVVTIFGPLRYSHIWEVLALFAFTPSSHCLA